MTDHAPPGETPDCAICGAQIELLEESVVLLSGQFMWFKEDNYAPLVLDEDSNFDVIGLDAPGLPTKKVMVLNPQHPGSLSVVHKICLQDMLQEDEDDDDNDQEDLDTQMLRAIENDTDYAEYGDPNHDPYWERR